MGRIAAAGGTVLSATAQPRVGPDPAPAQRRLRVLYVIDYLDMIGGAERLVTGLALNMPHDRIEPWVCSTRVGDPVPVATLTKSGIPHIDIKRRSRFDLAGLRRLAALVRRERFDVLHAHLFGSNVWGTLIGRACGVPVVLAHEHTWAYDNKVRVWIDGHVIGRLATRFLAVTDADRDRMIAVEGIQADKVLVMPVPYVAHTGSATTDIRAELGLDPAVRLIGVATVMRKQKALDVMLDAYARLLSDLPGVHLVLAGDGPCRNEIEAQIERLGIQSCVHLVGRRNDVDAILRQVDVGAMSSDFEGMPLFARECIAAGTPLVATAVGGLLDLITNEETGLLVPPRDPGALASALRRVLTDRSLAERLASTATERGSDLDTAAVARSYADLYERLVAEARPASASV
jgi:glycosyltransferase involved in cell wall biosynthesis